MPSAPRRVETSTRTRCRTRETVVRDCRDCGVSVGQPHDIGCDVARCLWSGGQRIGCDHGLLAECCTELGKAGRVDLADELAYHYSLDDPEHDCGLDIWTGEYPGVSDAREMDIWVRWGPPWIECASDHPDASPDLNRLHIVGRWDREKAKWVRR